MTVGDEHVFPGFLTPVLTQLSFQSHRLIFSHAVTELRGENTPERKFVSTGDRTHDHQVMSTTRSPLSHPSGDSKRQNLRLAKIQSICRSQNRCESNMKLCFWKGRKHCGKRRKGWLPAFSSFPTMFSIAFFPRVSKTMHCSLKGFKARFVRAWPVQMSRAIEKGYLMQFSNAFYQASHHSIMDPNYGSVTSTSSILSNNQLIKRLKVSLVCRKLTNG